MTLFLVITIAIVLYGGFIFAISRKKFIENASDFGRDFLIIVGFIVFNSLVFFSFLFSTESEIPVYEIRNVPFESVQKREVKVTELADYSEKLKLHIENQNFKLKSALICIFGLYTVPLIFIAIGISKQNKGNRE